MAVDDRVKFLVIQEIDRVLSEAAASPDDLHAELHALATKVASLEKRITELHERITDAASLDQRITELEGRRSAPGSRAQAAKKVTANT